MKLSSRKSVHSSVTANSSAIKTSTNEAYHIVKHTQEQDHLYEMVPMAAPRAAAGAYCEVNIGHRPTSETTAEKDLVYDIIPGQNK